MLMAAETFMQGNTAGGVQSACCLARGRRRLGARCLRPFIDPKSTSSRRRFLAKIAGGKGVDEAVFGLGGPPQAKNRRSPPGHLQTPSTHGSAAVAVAASDARELAYLDSPASGRFPRLLLLRCRCAEQQRPALCTEVPLCRLLAQAQLQAGLPLPERAQCAQISSAWHFSLSAWAPACWAGHHAVTCLSVHFSLVPWPHSRGMCLYYRDRCACNNFASRVSRYVQASHATSPRPCPCRPAAPEVPPLLHRRHHAVLQRTAAAPAHYWWSRCPRCCPPGAARAGGSEAGRAAAGGRQPALGPEAPAAAPAVGPAAAAPVAAAAPAAAAADVKLAAKPVHPAAGLAGMQASRLAPGRCRACCAAAPAACAAPAVLAAGPTRLRPVGQLPAPERGPKALPALLALLLLQLHLQQQQQVRLPPVPRAGLPAGSPAQPPARRCALLAGRQRPPSGQPCRF